MNKKEKKYVSSGFNFNIYNNITETCVIFMKLMNKKITHKLFDVSLPQIKNYDSIDDRFR